MSHGEKPGAAIQRGFHLQNVHWLWLAAAVIVVDQVSKQLVVHYLDEFDRIVLAPVLNLVRLHNTGAAFSLLAALPPWFFVAISLVVAIGIMLWLRRHPRGETLLAVGLSLIAGGALGNAIDRATRGFVVDFVDVHAASWHWPAFNVADSAITVGAALLLLDMWRKRGQSPRGS